MTTRKYIIKPRAQLKIRSFYKNVARKYRHTYDYDDFMRNVHDALFSIYDIECTLLRREPAIERWKGYHMANTDKWYFAYTIASVIGAVISFRQSKEAKKAKDASVAAQEATEEARDRFFHNIQFEGMESFVKDCEKFCRFLQEASTGRNAQGKKDNYVENELEECRCFLSALSARKNL